MDENPDTYTLLPLETSKALLKEALEKLVTEPEVLLKASKTLLDGGDQDLKRLSIALMHLGVHAYEIREWTPRPPTEGKKGHPRDPIGLERLKRLRAEFNRAAVSAFRIAIKGGPSPPAWILAGYRGEKLDPIAVEKAITSAREEWAEGRLNLSYSKVTPESSLREWAARAYLRAKGQPDDSESGRALLRSFEAPPGTRKRRPKHPE